MKETGELGYGLALCDTMGLKRNTDAGIDSSRLSQKGGYS